MQDYWRNCKFPGIVQQRVAYIFVSNSFQESSIKTEILNALSCDKFPVFCSFFNNDTFICGPGI